MNISQIISHLQSLSVEELKSTIEFVEHTNTFNFANAGFVKLKADIAPTPQLNELWLASCVAEELFDRGEYTRDELWRVTFSR